MVFWHLVLLGNPLDPCTWVCKSNVNCCNWSTRPDTSFWRRVLGCHVTMGYMLMVSPPQKNQHNQNCPWALGNSDQSCSFSTSIKMCLCPISWYANFNTTMMKWRVIQKFQLWNLTWACVAVSWAHHSHPTLSFLPPHLKILAQLLLLTRVPQMVLLWQHQKLLRKWRHYFTRGTKNSF